ncbi:MAG TPA: 6,7-dimethyl-8-ribityllumazine synthase [Brevundimonas sp.]|jgi:6,7-dimethyl-8-ribityllumazine synthase|uniref:6,7-dimethyl-8-ribityllumazine synthase n=1 Tax=Brevundimonas sp. TaxID=1871086 RepID=UPI002C579D6A|nr:6,7-dimethyl-8-ribityllumazine synthase [Brevundimonas sp.]HRH19176.1 6,7-dimethyl-8-ribityllumazine synthase [Brevundimonas sp.]
MIEEPVRVLIVEARFYDDLADLLLAGARRSLEAAGAEYNVVQVPGALEIPAAIAIAEESGRFPIGVRYDGYVALGCVIRGDTYHFEVVANESARGLTDLGIHHRLAIGNGILTTEDEDQANWRANPDQADKGGAAARACLDLIALKRSLRGASA